MAKINTAERRYQKSAVAKDESNPTTIISGFEHKSNEYNGSQSDLKNTGFFSINGSDAYVVSGMPETFSNDVKLDHEGRLYKYVNGEWHVYDIMDSAPITDESGVELTLDGVAESAEYPSFSDISAGAASSHRLVLYKGSSDDSYIYSIHPIKYGVEYDANGNSGKNVYYADVDYLVNDGFTQYGAESVLTYDQDIDGLFHCNETSFLKIDWTKIAFAYKPVYNVRVYAASDASTIRYVKVSTVSVGSESAESYISAATSSSNDKTFIIRNIDEANDSSGSNFTIFTIRGTATSPDQIIMEVW